VTDVILFDLGGVLVRLTGVPTMLEWTPENLTEGELWEKWLRSEAVRSFESGQIDPEAFAGSIIEEFRLTVSKTVFITAFETWIDGLFDGVEELLNGLRGRYRLASLSNTNTIHWPKLIVDMRLGDLIGSHFPSHKTDLLKPDAAAFENAIDQLSVPADRILFFDDNELNVTAAVACGLKAEIAQGPSDIESHLHRLGML
jgi:putative hydrolase of the HAD superfamily